MAQTATKPFHQTILAVLINHTGPKEDAQTVLKTIADLIMRTKISKNHDDIAEAFKDAFDYWENDLKSDLLSQVLDKLEKEKNERR